MLLLFYIYYTYYIKYFKAKNLIIYVLIFHILLNRLYLGKYLISI